jgi:hypothetical protein
VNAFPLVTRSNLRIPSSRTGKPRRPERG